MKQASKNIGNPTQFSADVEGKVTRLLMVQKSQLNHLGCMKPPAKIMGIFTISTAAGFLLNHQQYTHELCVSRSGGSDTKPEAFDQHVLGHDLMHPHPSEPENGRLPVTLLETFETKTIRLPFWGLTICAGANFSFREGNKTRPHEGERMPF